MSDSSIRPVVSLAVPLACLFFAASFFCWFSTPPCFLYLPAAPPPHHSLCEANLLCCAFFSLHFTYPPLFRPCQALKTTETKKKQKRHTFISIRPQKRTASAPPTPHSPPTRMQPPTRVSLLGVEVSAVRGGCKKCGNFGHTAAVCRNLLTVGPDGTVVVKDAPVCAVASTDRVAAAAAAARAAAAAAAQAESSLSSSSSSSSSDSDDDARRRKKRDDKSKRRHSHRSRSRSRERRKRKDKERRHKDKKRRRSRERKERRARSRD